MLSFISAVAFPQKNRELFLFDMKSKTPVSNATIKAINCRFGTYSSNNGGFEVPDSIPTIKITSIGYVTIDEYSLSNNSDTIFIEQSVQELQEIQVKNHRLVETLSSGIIKAKVDFKWGPSGKGEEFAQRFRIDFAENQILKLKKIYLAAKNFDPTHPVLIHIYSVNKITKLPENELLDSSILVKKENFNGKKIEIDLSSLKLYIYDNEFFVGFQWLAKNNSSTNSTNTLLLMTNELSEELTYSRTLVSKNYNWFPAPKLSKSINPTNTIFSIEVEKYEK